MFSIYDTPIYITWSQDYGTESQFILQLCFALYVCIYISDSMSQNSLSENHSRLYGKQFPRVHRTRKFFIVFIRPAEAYIVNQINPVHILVTWF